MMLEELEIETIVKLKKVKSNNDKRKELKKKQQEAKEQEELVEVEGMGG